MKRRDQVAHFRNLDLAHLRQDLLKTEKEIQAQVLAVAFSTSKQVRIVRNLRQQLARGLTIATQKLSQQEDK